MASENKKELPLEVEEMQKDLKKFSSLEAVSLSEGGKILIESLIVDIVNSVDTLGNRYGDMSIQQFVSICAEMKSKLDLVRVLTRAKKNKLDLKDLIAETLQE